jgi:hypothetical protein
MSIADIQGVTLAVCIAAEVLISISLPEDSDNLEVQQQLPTRHGLGAEEERRAKICTAVVLRICRNALSHKAPACISHGRQTFVKSEQMQCCPAGILWLSLPASSSAAGHSALSAGAGVTDTLSDVDGIHIRQMCFASR